MKGSNKKICEKNKAVQQFEREHRKQNNLSESLANVQNKRISCLKFLTKNLAYFQNFLAIITEKGRGSFITDARVPNFDQMYYFFAKVCELISYTVIIGIEQVKAEPAP